jgi:hypothetical protein
MSSVTPSQSPFAFSYTIDLTKAAFAAMFGLVVLGGFYLANLKPTPAFVQPSVPSLIPPPLSCACGTSRAVTKPFSVTCPYCRNTLTVQPSATGSASTGEVIRSVVKPAVK